VDEGWTSWSQRASLARTERALRRTPHGAASNRGRTGIRTLERLAPLAVFKTAAFVRSAIPPPRV
jgi:hypothetical protein